eukprot:g12559.t1
MGAEPALRRKQTLTPLQPAPRAPVADFGAQDSEGDDTDVASDQRGSYLQTNEQDVELSVSAGSSSADAIAATLAGVAENVKNAIKAYEQTISLPYDSVPTEVCRARDGTRSIDLASWSLLVDDVALRCIAAGDRNRIDELAAKSSVNKVDSHIDAMGLTAAFKGIDSSGVARFDASSMVAWREKQTLERMKLEEMQHARDHFTEKESLTCLDIGGARGVRDGGIAALAAQCRRLQSLNMSGAHRVTDVAIRSLAVNCTGLTQLNLSGCVGICGPGLAVVGECCPRLMHLDLSDCKQIGHWVLTRLFRGCHELETLSLARCHKVGNEELKEIGVGCRGLVDLDLRDCNQALAKGCTALQTLILDRCFQVSKTALRAVGGGLHSLKRLSLARCPALTLEGMSAVAKGCPSLTDLNLPKEREERERSLRATKIQRRFRGVLGRRKTRRRAVEVAKRRKMEVSAALKIQQRFRMHSAKITCARLRDQAERLRRKRDGGARVLQGRWRSYCARQKLENMKRLLKLEKAKQQAAATCIQKFVRASRCRRILERKQKERAHRHASATVIQRHYRGVVARVHCVEREKSAALRLQCWQRLVTSKKLLGLLIMKKKMREVQEGNAAKQIQQSYRRYKIRVEAHARKKNHEDEVRAMSRLEDWAATRIQALARGKAGRGKAAARRLEHMGRWKEMYDQDRGANFYYNKDDENGWQLRVAPEREPAEERGEWTRYAAAGDESGSTYPEGQDLFYNAVTGESTYQVPAEWGWLETQPLETSFFDAESEDVANNSTSTWGNDISQVTGDSTYYAGVQLALQEDCPFAGGDEGQQYGGTMVEGGAAEYASSGDWAKYYDADYACDYYHNFRQQALQIGQELNNH